MECKVTVSVNISGNYIQGLNTDFYLDKKILSLSNKELETNLKNYLQFHYNDFMNQFEDVYISFDDVDEDDIEGYVENKINDNKWKEALFTGFTKEEEIYGDIVLKAVLVINNQSFVLQPF